MLRVLAIAPNEGLALTMLEVSRERKELQTTVLIGDLADGVKAVSDTNPADYDVILSRGGTAKMIAQTFPKPVVEIHPSIYDLLRAIRLVGGYGDRFAVVGFRSMTQNIETVLEIMRQPVRVITITDAQAVGESLTQLKAEGYTTIIGDTIAIRQAQQLHMDGVLIASGSESIHAALDEALKLYKHLERLQQERLLQAEIMTRLDVAYGVFGPDDALLVGLGLSENLCAKLAAQCDCVRQRGEVNLIRQSDGCIYKVHGCLQTYLDKPCVRMVVSEKNGAWHSPALSFYDEAANSEKYHDNVGAMRECLRQAEGLRVVQYPVIVAAEDGTDLSALLLALSGGSGQNRPLVHIDCAQLDSAGWKTLIHKESSPLSENGQLLVFRHPESMTADIQNQLVAYAQATCITKRNRLVMVFDMLSEDGPLYRYLQQERFSLLRVPPLRERHEDLPKLASLLTGHYNYHFSKQVIGFEPAAMETLISYDWPQNTEQFYRIIRQLVLTAEGDTITAAAVDAQLSSEKSVRPSADACAVDLSGTLDEITFRVVQAVLMEEGMNKSKVAQRLGIGRTTLWRLLGRQA